MNLKERLVEDMKSALKRSEKERLSVIRMARAAILKVEKDTQKDLNDDEVLEVLAKEIKKNKEALADFVRGNREDLVKKAEYEIGVISEYLPKQLTREELSAIVKDAIISTESNGFKDIGKVMSFVMPTVKGRADGKMVNELAKEFLS